MSRDASLREHTNGRVGQQAHPPLPLCGQVPAVSLDRIRFGFECANLSFDAASFDSVNSKYVESVNGLSNGSTRRLEYRFPIINSLVGRDIGIAHLNLTIRAQIGTTMRIEGSISFNPLRCLRTEMNLDDLIGLDGNDNLCGPTDMIPDIEGKCLTVVEAALEAVTKAFFELFGLDVAQDESCALWVQACEVTRDLDMPDARHKAHRLLAAVLRGRLYVDRSLYSGPVGGSLEAGFAVVRAYRRKTGAALKTYAKQTSTMRLEWVIDERRDARAELLNRRVTMSPGDAASLVREAISLARDDLLQLQDEVLAVCRSTATPLDVARALHPLFLLATSSAPARGPEPSVPVQEEAAAAYGSLLLTGQCTLSPGSGGGRLRECLLGLAAVGALVRQGRRLCFALPASLAAAMVTRGYPAGLDEASA